MKNNFLDIHVLQTVPSSNLNRDDAGSPKTAIYGGVLRSRVSSQSWKRAMRKSFDQTNTSLYGKRTKNLIGMLVNCFLDLNEELTEDKALEMALKVASDLGIKTDSKNNNETKALLFISHGQIRKLCEYILNHEDADKIKDYKKELTRIFKENQSLDLALFGRMVADNPELNVEGSAQVAHAISTHEVTPEFDYFTALDDLAAEDTSGSSMIGTLEYNSSTLYRYANLNINELVDNIGSQLAIESVKEYIRTFILSMPTGKQNTFANKTIPSYVMINIRTDTPVNLVSAFETPVKSKNDGYMKESVKSLESEYNDSLKFTDEPMETFVLSSVNSEITNNYENLNSLMTAVELKLSEVIGDENSNN